MASASENTDDDPLPTGWITVSHQDLGVCYVHPVSRACTWSRPRVVDTDRPEEQPMPEDETQLSNAVQMEVQWALRDASERKRDAGEGQQPNDGPLRKPLADPRQQLERELANRPRSSYADFRHKLVPGGDRLMRDAASMLRSYASQMLAARVEVDERPEPGEWPYSPAPTRVSIRVLGVLVGEAVGSGHDIAKKVATESALLTLCPLRWLEELHSIGWGPQLAEHGRCYQPTIVDVAGRRSRPAPPPHVLARLRATPWCHTLVPYPGATPLRDTPWCHRACRSSSGRAASCRARMRMPSRARMRMPSRVCRSTSR